MIKTSVLLALALSAATQPEAPTGPAAPAAGLPSSSMPPILREVGFDQRLGAQVPLDAPFGDEQGRTVTLATILGTRPVVLAFVYYECPMLCTQVLNGLTGAMKALSLDVGRDFDVIAVSFDAREGPELAAAKKRSYVERYNRPDADQGWHFLTGSESSIRRVTGAVGFRFVYDDALGQFAHPAGVVVLTPEGRVSRYLFGIEFGPRNLKFALMDASDGRIGTFIDQVLLYCYHYDPASGRYGVVVMRLIRLAGVATVLALGAFIVAMKRRDAGTQEAGGRRPGAGGGGPEACP